MGSANKVAAKTLSGAGLPTSISDIPNWFAHFTGQAAESKAFYQPFVDAAHDPTERNIVGAVPFVGPTAVSMSDDARVGDYDSALGTLAGTVAGAGMAGEVRPGLKARAAETMDAFRTSEGNLTTGAKAASRLIGGATLGAAGHVFGVPEAGLIGAIYGPRVADAFLPNRAPVPDFYGGAYGRKLRSAVSQAP